MLERNSSDPFQAPAPIHPAAPPPAYPGYPTYGFNPYGPQGAQEFEEPFNPLKLFWIALQYRWLILAFLVVGVASGVVYTWMQTPQYIATAKMEVLNNNAKVIQEYELVNDALNFRTLETARLKMNSVSLARRIVFALDLAEKADFIAPRPSFSITNVIDRAFGINSQADVSNLTAAQRERIAVARIRGGLSAAWVKNTTILNVSYRHPVAEYTALVANQAVKSYMDQSVDSSSETSDLTRQFIQEQVLETKQKLEKSERSLLSYAKEAGITITGDESSLLVANLQAINSAIAEATQERFKLERLVQQIDDGKAESLEDVISSESVRSAKVELANLKATYQQKLRQFKPGFPEMVALRAQIRELERQANNQIRVISQSIRLKHEQSVAREADLRNELKQLETKQAEFQDKNVQYTILKREVDSNRKQYESLIQKLNAVGIGADLKTQRAEVLDLAVRPGAPYAPSLSRNLAAALLFFAVLSGGAIYVSELLNNTFTVPDQIESELKLNVLGIIPAVEESKIEEELLDNSSALSEAYRSLRTSLQFTGANDGLKSVLVTSSEPSEGKTTTALRLAQDFAALGKQVLLIDGDLRKPRLHRALEADNAIGLSNLLSNVIRQGDVSNMFQRTKYPNLWFLSAGTIPPNPADLLSSHKMSLTLHFCTKKYDMVIVDSAPIVGLSDAPILSRLVESTLLVVASRQTTRKSARNALNRLLAAGANVAGVAMMRFEASKLDYSDAYRYMQYNYYTYGSDQPAISDQSKMSAANENSDEAPGSFSSVLDRVKRRFS
ncbi:MAG: polysaccharide biosynthesis tyrosine autokinase [Pseudomonadota bacterium]